MTVIIANDTPDAIRGMLKRWFIEPRPNVFAGTVNRRTREKTMDYIKRNGICAGYVIIHSDNNCQGFRIENLDPSNRKGVEVSGLFLIAEKEEG
jgi:CRISPR-associated protein Cas2